MSAEHLPPTDGAAHFLERSRSAEGYLFSHSWWDGGGEAEDEAAG